MWEKCGLRASFGREECDLRVIKDFQILYLKGEFKSLKIKPQKFCWLSQNKDWHHVYSVFSE
jgi:hypothetical protein